MAKTIEDAKYIANKHKGRCLSKTYVNAHTKLVWQCENGHIWKQTYNNIQQNHWCKECYNDTLGQKRRHTQQYIKQFLEEKNGQLLSIYETAHTPITIKCNKCNTIWNCLFNNIRNGTWCPVCSKENRKNTCLEKYGTTNPMQNINIANKCSLSQKNSYIIEHWKTAEQLICQGSWEKKVVEWLNNNQVDFEWQKYTFKMPNGKIYRPDFLLIQQNKWIEIKRIYERTQ